MNNTRLALGKTLNFCLLMMTNEDDADGGSNNGEVAERQEEKSTPCVTADTCDSAIPDSVECPECGHTQRRWAAGYGCANLTKKCH